MNIKEIEVTKILTNNARPLDKAHLKHMVDNWNDDFNRPLLALEYKDEYIIYDGHHRFEAQKELGRKTVVIQIADVFARSKKEMQKIAYYRYSMIQSERTKSQTTDDLGLSYMKAEEKNIDPTPIMIKSILEKSGLFISNKKSNQSGGVSIGDIKEIEKATQTNEWVKNQHRISYNTVKQLVKQCMERVDSEEETVVLVSNLLERYKWVYRQELQTTEFKLALLKVLLNKRIDCEGGEYGIFNEMCSFVLDTAIKKYCRINKCGREFGVNIKWISKQGGQPSEKSLESCFTDKPISMDTIKKAWYKEQYSKVA